MSRLRILLQYESGKYLHLGLISVLTILSATAYIALVLLVFELIFLWKKSRRLFSASLILVLLFSFDLRLDNDGYPSGYFEVDGRVVEVFEDSFRIEGDYDMLVYSEEAGILDSGMIVRIEGYYHNIETKDIMNTFDYEAYLKSQGIEAVGTAISVEVVGHTFTLLTLRDLLAEFIDNRFSAQNAIYLKLFILGINETDDAISTVENQLGITHLFAISGMHLGLLAGILNSFLTRLRLRQDRIKLVVIIFMFIFNIVSGFRLSLVRATLLVFGIYLKDFLGLMLSKTDILAFIMIGFLIINPYFLYSLGFQLSFLVAFALILGREMIGKSDLILKMARTTIIATAVSLPITLSVNRELGLAFIFANLFFIIYVGYLFLPISLLVLALPILEPLYGFVVKGFEVALIFFEKINLVIGFAFPNTLYKIFFWLGLLIIFVGYRSQKRIITGIMILLATVLTSFAINFESRTFVRFLDVGQGDAIHIHDGGCDMLIDTGDVDNHDTLIDYFKSYNLKRLDYLVITHFHSDHFGELTDIRDEFEIGMVLVSHQTEVIQGDYMVLKTSDKFICGDSNFIVLSADHHSANENNNSLVLLANIGGENYLFTGDTETDIENELVTDYPIKVSVLKVGHHGSDTASASAFLDAFNPDLAVISVAENNIYDFPDQAVMNRLKDHDIMAYQTALSGTITIYYYPLLRLRVIETYEKQRLRRYVPSLM